MDLILPGVYHWCATHPNTGSPAHAYAVGATLVDPILPDDGIEALPGPVEQIVLTNRHHYRSSAEIARHFGCPVRCHEAGLHEFAGTDRVVEGYTWGQQLAGDVEAVELDAICPEETVLHVHRGDGALAFADGVVRLSGDALEFVPDGLLGDDPEQVKADLRSALAALLDREFDALLFAHGDPIVGGGKQRLTAFVEAGG
jgi:hypothetical protein